MASIWKLFSLRTILLVWILAHVVSSSGNICTSWIAAGGEIDITMNSTMIAGTGSSCSCEISLVNGTQILYFFDGLMSSTCGTGIELSNSAIDLTCENSMFRPSPYAEAYSEQETISLKVTANNDPNELMSGFLKLTVLQENGEISVECFANTQSNPGEEEKEEEEEEEDQPQGGDICTSWNATARQININVDSTIIAGSGSSCSCVMSLPPVTPVVYGFDMVTSTTCGTSFQLTDNFVTPTCQNSNFQPPTYTMIYPTQRVVFLQITADSNPEEVMSGIFKINSTGTGGEIFVDCFQYLPPEPVQPPEEEEEIEEEEPLGGDICTNWNATGQRIDINMNSTIIAGTGRSCVCEISPLTETQILYDFSNVLSSTCGTTFSFSDDSFRFTCQNSAVIPPAYAKDYLPQVPFSLLITSNLNPVEVMSGILRIYSLTTDVEFSAECFAYEEPTTTVTSSVTTTTVLPVNPGGNICTNWNAKGTLIDIHMNSTMLAGTSGQCSCVFSLFPGTQVFYDFSNVISPTCGTTLSFTDDSRRIICENSAFIPPAYQMIYPTPRSFSLLLNANSDPEEVMSGILQIISSSPEFSAECFAYNPTETATQETVKEESVGGNICTKWNGTGNQIEINMNSAIIAGTETGCFCAVSILATTQLLYSLNDVTSTTCGTNFTFGDDSFRFTCENSTFTPSTFERVYFPVETFFLRMTANSDPDEVMSGILRIYSLTPDQQIYVKCIETIIKEKDDSGAASIYGSFTVICLLVLTTMLW